MRKLHRRSSSFLSYSTLLTLGLTVAACGAHDELGIDGEPTATKSDALIEDIGAIEQFGARFVFSRIKDPTGITISKLVGLTACDKSSLYAVQQDSTSVFSLWFSSNQGQTWTKQATPGKGPEIACDHAMLATLDSSKRVHTASLSMNGVIGAWTLVSQTTTVDRIQGGDGSFYGVKAVSGGKQVFVASNKATVSVPTWGSVIATIGAVQVTGTGATVTGSDNQSIGNSVAWPRRAYALEANGTVFMNDNLLDGNNGWTLLSTGTERYSVLSAAEPNLLFAIKILSGGAKEINRITVSETDCDDGIDNDANGFKDGEDTACYIPVASTFCASRSNGKYCGNRFPSGTAIGQPGEKDVLVTCSGGVANDVKRGVCVRNPNSSIVNADALATEASLAIPKPASTGQWCNVHWADGTWEAKATTDESACSQLSAMKPNGKIVRAGLYSIEGQNQVLANCSDGALAFQGTGVTPWNSTLNGVGKGTNRCVFTMSPTKMEVFGRMFQHSHEVGNRVALPFIHNVTPIPLAQFGQGESGTSNGIDVFGKDQGGQREAAYDHALNEGRPVLAVAAGVVLANGSRDRNVSTLGGQGTPYQGEMFVRHRVGTNATYQETFVTAYAHLRKRLVVSGQSVRAGQILGYVGATGAAGGYAHLHSGVHRLSNINAQGLGQTPTDAAFGYHVNFLLDNSSTGSNMGGANAVDALGFLAPAGLDPWGHWDRNTAVSGRPFKGIGAWNIALFKAGEQFVYP